VTEKIGPALFRWDGQVMIPHPRFQPLCTRQFAVGEEYALAPPEFSSTASRRHFFASLHDAWLNLPERDKRFPTSEHFRKWLLVHTGFADERTIVCDTRRDAKNLALAARDLDGFAVIECRECVVKIWTAKSQSAQAMGHEEFQASKNAVLDEAAKMIGVTRTELVKKGGRAA
jgi:hypothetical protein